MTEHNEELRFPSDFLWGSATAAFQIEGASRADGRTDSIWDTFCRVPGAVLNGDDGEVACDHYHRWPQDVALMADLKLDAYRFSISWPRIVPEPGVVNQAGLDFYSRLVDGLLERGVLPWLTLYHWDLPQWLEDRGGWTDRGVVQHFAELATIVHDALGDRVRHWTTFNEPWCSAFLGYAGGQHAPGRMDPQAGVSAAHHLLLAHGTSIRVLREKDPAALLGITLNMTVADPVDPEDPVDVRAAARAEAGFNHVFAQPIFDGTYPELALADYAAAGVQLPIEDGDLEIIRAPIDFLGLNYYHGDAYTGHEPAPGDELPGAAAVERPTRNPNVGLDDVHVVSRGLPRTAMDWEVQPDGLRRLLEAVHARYSGPAGVPLYVTENGAAYDDTVEPDGSVQDTERASYLLDHARAVHAALTAGVDVRGYFAWSLLDNFEWAYGYGQRFGIVRVDFDTLERTPKLSAREYARVAATRSVSARDTVRT